MASKMSTTNGLSTTCSSPLDRDMHCLSFQQVERLTDLLSEPVLILPKEGNFPTLTISPSRLIKVVRKQLHDKGIDVIDVRLNGSAASYCLAEDREKHPRLQYNDLDVIFRIHIRSEFDLHIIKDEVLNSLFHFFPEGTQTERISSFMLEESYVKKMVKITSCNDRWSLISLGDEKGKNIELKFVDSMKRQYEFSVDSFQITLDPLFCFEFEDSLAGKHSPIKIDPDFYPHIQATALYGDFSDAQYHLNNRLIATRNPEEIRGGGLLKYCSLIVTGYQPANVSEMESHEPYMCSRFFIDFPLGNLQYAKINKYLFTRFLQPGNPKKGIEFLDELLAVVSKQAKCLMESERRKTITILLQIKAGLSWHYHNPYFNLPFYPPQPFWHYQHHHHHHYVYTRNHSKQSSQSVVTTPPLIQFPHTANNAVPIGPTPTPVR